MYLRLKYIKLNFKLNKYFNIYIVRPWYLSNGLVVPRSISMGNLGTVTTVTLFNKDLIKIY